MQRELERYEESEETGRRAVALTDEAAGADSVMAGFARDTLTQTLRALRRVDANAAPITVVRPNSVSAHPRSCGG